VTTTNLVLSDVQRAIQAVINQGGETPTKLVVHPTAVADVAPLAVELGLALEVRDDVPTMTVWASC
jgi:hypothetical protein